MEQSLIERKFKRLVDLHSNYKRISATRLSFLSTPNKGGGGLVPPGESDETRKTKRRADKREEKKLRKRQREESNRKSQDISDSRRLMTREEALSLIPEKKTLFNVRVKLEDRLKILDLMQERLLAEPTKAARFRTSHTLNPRPTEDIFVPSLSVIENNKSIIHCSVCDKKIHHGEDRCKIELFLTEKNLDDLIDRDDAPRDQKIDFCLTHGYCVPCFLQYISTCKPGHTCVCFATCQERGGCRQPGAKSSSSGGKGKNKKE